MSGDITHRRLYAMLTDDGVVVDATTICSVCRVLHKHGQPSPNFRDCTENGALRCQVCGYMVKDNHQDIYDELDMTDIEEFFYPTIEKRAASIKAAFSFEKRAAEYFSAYKQYVAAQLKHIVGEIDEHELDKLEEKLYQKLDVLHRSFNHGELKIVESLLGDGDSDILKFCEDFKFKINIDNMKKKKI